MAGHNNPITILGAGSWGTALALHLARQGQTVRLWSCEIDEVAALLAERENTQFLPGYPFPDNIEPTANLADALSGVNTILVAVPSVGYRDTLTLLKSLIGNKTNIICATKGIDAETNQMLHEVTAEILGEEHPYAVISGPSFAKEVAAEKPTCVNVASTNQKLRDEVCERFNSPVFHVFPTADVVGTEIGGVVKNVIAIATGISDGMELGTNARSALITRGLNEILALGKSLGGHTETFISYSGLGDLILTCSDDQSRNRRLGLAIGKGNNIDAAEKAIGQVVEGKNSAALVEKLAEQHGVHMPVCEAICTILQGKGDAKETFMQLMTSVNNNSKVTA